MQTSFLDLQEYCLFKRYDGSAKEGEKMGTRERRLTIWNTLRQRKQDTTGHFATKFHVSLCTIYYDLEHLSLICPLEVIRGRYHGGIKIADYFTPDKTKLPPVQLGLMLHLCANLYGNNKFTMLSILKKMNKRILKMLCLKGGATFTAYS